MMRTSGSRLAVLGLGALLLAGCGSLKLFQSTDDKAITTNVQANLFSDPVLKTRDIHVESQNGIVTLSGSVGTDSERAAVERIATGQNGVKKVVDLLTVNSLAAATVPEPVEVAPAEPSAGQKPPSQIPDMTSSTRASPRRVKATAKHKDVVEALSASKEKPQDQTGKNQDKSALALEAYTNSVAQGDAQTYPPRPAPNTIATPPAGSNSNPAAAAPPPAPAAPPAAPAAPAPKPPEQVTIPAGTVVAIRTVDSIDSSRNKAGEEFAATLDATISVGGRTLGAPGADARIRLVDAKSAGSLSGQSELQLQLISVTINGTPYATQSGYYEQHGASRGTRTAETVGAGAVVGAVLGGIFGHGKGAAIGSIAGAGAGTAVQASTKGQQVKVPSETRIDFTLKEPVTVTLSTN